MPPEKIRKIVPSEDIDGLSLEQNLETYTTQAVELGATESKVIDTSQIVVDERVTLKCRIPLCFGYGTCANCPPHCLEPQQMREILEKYKKAIVFNMHVAPEVIVREKATIKQRAGAYVTAANIVDAIESAAFYDGHYLAVGFAAGSCKSTFCYNAECAVLTGQKCRRALKSRPSMEAVGIDCYRLATSLGWQIYPIGSDAKAQCVPYGLLMGLVLVA